MKKINNLKEFYDLIENNDKVIFYWHTKWCPDCFAIKPHLGKLEEDFADYDFYSINRDLDIELAKHLNIFGIPSFQIYKDHEEIGRFVDKKRKSYIEVKEFITKTIN